MSSVTDLLNRKKEDIKRPPNAPIGHYRFKISRPPVQQEVKGGLWTLLTFFCTALAAQEDVDERQMEEFGRPVETVRSAVKFMFNNDGSDDATVDNENTSWYVQEFLDRLGLDAGPEETQAEQIARCEGCEFIGQLTHQQDKNNPDLVRDVISRTLSLEEVPSYV